MHFQFPNIELSAMAYSILVWARLIALSDFFVPFVNEPTTIQSYFLHTSCWTFGEVWHYVYCVLKYDYWWEVGFGALHPV